MATNSQAHSRVPLSLRLERSGGERIRGDREKGNRGRRIDAASCTALIIFSLLHLCSHNMNVGETNRWICKPNSYILYEIDENMKYDNNAKLF